MLRVFIAHFSPVKFSKNHFTQKGQTPGFIKGERGTIQSANSIKFPTNTLDPYISSISFLLQVSSLPISIMYQSVYPYTLSSDMTGI